MMLLEPNLSVAAAQERVALSQPGHRHPPPFAFHRTRQMHVDVAPVRIAANGGALGPAGSARHYSPAPKLFGHVVPVRERERERPKE
jgi:hypothetical protein